MFEVREKPDMVEKAMLVGFCFHKLEEPETQLLLSELEELVDTLGIEIVGMELVRVRDTNKGFICGTGKADELVELARARGCDCIVFDNEVSPMQQRNWEELADMTIIDREEVILDIFAKRARTKEARLQVDLARMQYALPRLARMWGHLDREGGGGGGTGGGGASRGMGEQQVEIDRRLARKKISRLKTELEDVRRQRATQRKERQTNNIATAAIVGYTNAGKSTLLNKLAGSDVMEADMLFATLDPTTRRIKLEDGQDLLLSDTVGFVRNLPHRLVESFKATLEEAILADFLIHVLDASSEEIVEHYHTTRKVLAELGADEKRVIMVLNKMDRVEDPAVLNGLRAEFPGAFEASAVTGAGLTELTDRFTDLLADRVKKLTYRVPQSRGDISGLVHREGKVLETDYEGNDILLTAIVPKSLEGLLEEFLLDSD
ncbi:MAG: GTP-binding protein HflX [Akkermansiaceae bacterium]|jgi:GTP-binding protein HflX|tara:strand:- start:197 stop:1498 length:1302 start_codon:yes stop_codon:yes gene_type:complete